MAWTQVYEPLGGIGLSALAASVPLIILFYMLAFRQAKGHIAAVAGLVGALLVAILVWKMPVGLAVNSVALGACFGLFPIVWIVITAVWVYNMTVESGEFEIIKDSLARLTDDRRLQALFIAFAFSCFIEGTAGFGTPVAIAAAMLVGLGFTPLWGAGIALIANTAPVAFGAIGVPLIVAAQVSGLDQMTVSAIAGRQLPLLSLIVPLWVCVVMCGFKRSMEVLPAIIVAGVAFGGAQFLLANFHGPTLPDIGSAIATIVALMLLLKVWQPKSIFRFEGEAPSNLEGQGYPLAVVLRAWAPYLVLAVFVFFWGLGSFKAILNGLPGTVFNISWPGLDGEVMKTAPIVPADAVYGAKFTFNWLSAGGTAILLSGLVSVPFMPKYGYGKAIACFMRTHPDHRHDPGPGLPDELLRHELHPGSGLHPHRLAVPLLLSPAGLAGRVPDRFRHVLLRPVRRHAEGHRPGRGHAPRTGRGLQRLRWRDRQDDLAPVPVRGYRRHQQCRSGRQALPLHHRSQHRHDPGALRAGLPAGWSPFLDAALTGMAQA